MENDFLMTIITVFLSAFGGSIFGVVGIIAGVRTDIKWIKDNAKTLNDKYNKIDSRIDALQEKIYNK